MDATLHNTSRPRAPCPPPPPPVSHLLPRRQPLRLNLQKMPPIAEARCDASATRNTQQSLTKMSIQTRPTAAAYQEGGERKPSISKDEFSVGKRAPEVVNRQHRPVPRSLLEHERVPSRPGKPASEVTEQARVRDGENQQRAPGVPVGKIFLVLPKRGEQRGETPIYRAATDAVKQAIKTEEGSDEERVTIQ